jgi:hypothetical protein
VESKLCELVAKVMPAAALVPLPARTEDLDLMESYEQFALSSNQQRPTKAGTRPMRAPLQSILRRLEHTALDKTC